MTDYPDYQTPQAHATQIAATGVPLLTSAQPVLTQSFNPAAGATQSSAAQTVTRLGFEMVVQSSFGVAPTTPFVRVQLEWFYTGYSARVATDTYICAASTTPGAFTTYVTGPTKGDQVTVHVTNLDGLQVNLTTVSILENSRVYPRTSARWDNGANTGLAVAGFTLPKLPADERVLGMEAAAAVAAGASVAWLCGIHDGLVNFGIDLVAASGTNLVAQVAAEPGGEYVANNPLYSVVNPPTNFQIACPRAPVRFQLHNNGTTALSVTWSAVRAD